MPTLLPTAKLANRRFLIPALIALGIGLLSLLCARLPGAMRESALQNADIPELQRLIDANPRDGAALYYLGRRMQEEGDKTGALQALRQAADRENSVRANFAAGTACLEAGAAADAQKYLVAVTRAEPANAAAWYRLGLAFERFNPESAYQAFAKAARLKPDNAVFWTHLGVSASNTGRRDEAERCLRKALQLSPETPEALAGLGNVLLEQGGQTRLIEARSLLQKAAAVKPQYTYARLTLGKVYVALGDGENAVRMLESCRPESRLSPTLWYSLIRAYRLTGAQNKAAEAQAQFVRVQRDAERFQNLLAQGEQNPKDPVLRLQIGRLLVARGDTAQAMIQFSQCLALDPTNSEAKAELQKLGRPPAWP